MTTPDVILTTPVWFWTSGTAAIFFAVKYLWPLMRQSRDSQITQGRVESGLLNQIARERDKALMRADEANRRSDELFAKLAEVQTQLTIMTSQLQVANDKITHLSSKLDSLTRAR